MSGDTVTVSAKLPRDLRDRIDDVGKKPGISNHSIVGKPLESFVEEHGLGGIPTVDSEVGGGRRKNIRIEEIASTTQECTNSSETQGKEEEQEG